MGLCNPILVLKRLILTKYPENNLISNESKMQSFAFLVLLVEVVIMSDVDVSVFVRTRATTL